jgi:hypothetical protein
MCEAMALDAGVFSADFLFLWGLDPAKLLYILG